VNIPSNIPSVFTRGTTVKWTQGFSDFRADDGWTAKVYMVGASAVLNTGTGVSGSANGANFDFVLSVALTDLAPGDYRYEIRATKAGEEYVAESGKVTIIASLESAAAGSALSTAEKELAAIETAIASRLTDDVQEYAIEGRSMVKIPMEQLYQMRAALREEVWREKNPGRIGPSMLAVFTGLANEGTVQ
jgi:hypothetical protein